MIAGASGCYVVLRAHLSSISFLLQFLFTVSSAVCRYSHTHLFLLRRRRVQYQDKAGTCCAKLTHLHKRIRVTIFPSPRCGLFSQVRAP
ncbi:hypothetical protein J3E68DRAFT_405535 [Trichoderma sp. SZMC 28012]